MAEMSRRFNFDNFDEQIREALDRNQEAMADVVPSRPPRPGEIGSVVTRLTFRPDFDPLPEPPEAA